MRIVIFALLLLVSVVVQGATQDKTPGQMLLENKSSPFTLGELSGGAGAVPEVSGALLAQKKIFSMTKPGAIGLLGISDIFSISEIEISEVLDDRHHLKSRYVLDDDKPWQELVSDVTRHMRDALSDNGIKSLYSCVRGSFWHDGQTYSYEVCYKWDGNNWVPQTSKFWPIGTQEP